MTPPNVPLIRMTPSDPPLNKGIKYIGPPPNLLADATRVLDSMILQMRPDSTVAGVGIATDVGWNAAVVARVGDNVKVITWIGQDWGSKITGGGAIRFEF